MEKKMSKKKIAMLCILGVVILALLVVAIGYIAGWFDKGYDVDVVTVAQRDITATFDTRVTFLLSLMQAHSILFLQKSSLHSMKQTKHIKTTNRLLPRRSRSWVRSRLRLLRLKKMLLSLKPKHSNPRKKPIRKLNSRHRMPRITFLHSPMTLLLPAKL